MLCLQATTFGIGEALGPGPGIGIAGIDDHRRRPPAVRGEQPAVEDHRRRGEGVAGARELLLEPGRQRPEQRSALRVGPHDW